LPGFDRYFLTMPPTVFPVFWEILIAGQEFPFFVEIPLFLNLGKNPKISLDSSMRCLLYHHKKESLPP